MTDRNPHQQYIEHITWNEQHIATIIRSNFLPDETTFVTPDHYYQQTGFVVYPKGGVIKRHAHLPLQRHLTGTQEALLVRKGRVEIDSFAMDKSPLGTWPWNRVILSSSWQVDMACGVLKVLFYSRSNRGHIRGWSKRSTSDDARLQATCFRTRK
jgi:hypothetical protein